MGRSFGQRELWFVALSLANFVRTGSATRAPLCGHGENPAHVWATCGCCALTAKIAAMTVPSESEFDDSTLPVTLAILSDVQ